MSADDAVHPSRWSLRDLESPHAAARHVDGAWWPRTHELAAGITELIREVALAGFTVRRVGFSLDDTWTATPRKISVNGRSVKLGGFHQQHAHTITLVGDGGWERLQLVVIPPEADEHAAERALVAASLTTGDNLSAEDILAGSQAPMTRTD